MTPPRGGTLEPHWGWDVIQFEGLEEAQAYLANISEEVKDDASWRGPMGKFGEALRRYAVSISPIVTGSYANAHTVSVSGKGVGLFISPVARNTKTGALVSRYAGAVEGRHRVYAMTAVKGADLAPDVLQEVLEGIGL